MTKPVNELRRRNNGGELVIVPTEGNGPRTANGARKALWLRTPPFKVEATKINGEWYLITSELAAMALASKRVTLTPYAGRFPRLAAFWLRSKAQAVTVYVKVKARVSK